MYVLPTKFPMNRRTFLTTTALASSAFLSTAQEPAAKKRPKLKKAVNLGMAKIKGELADKFKVIKDTGFDGVELNLPDDQWDVAALEKAKGASGLEIAGIICTTHWAQPLSSPKPEVRERTVRALQMALEQGGQLGCKSVLLVPGTVEKDVTYEQCWERSIEGIKRCLPAAEKSKCAIAVENVWNRFINEPVAAKRFIEEINHPLVGWHFDIGNCVTFGWPEHWVRTLGKKHTTNLHIKEYSRKKRDKEGPYAGFAVELMEGDNDWPSVMKALDEIGYEGYGILEVGGGDEKRLQFLAERTDKIFAL
jgi:L-ribulose-5-phosphate 3-epimerase